MSLAGESSLSAAELSQIARAETRPAPRTMVLRLDDRIVVVKRQRTDRMALGYRILDLVAWLSHQPWLRGVRISAGKQGQADELARLRALEQAGVAVPQVLHVDSDFFVMGYAQGTDLASMLPREPDLMRHRWGLGLAFLRDAHAHGQYLSQAFARNMILTDQSVVAVDFEDDPLRAMSLAAAQTRDWLAYLHSTLWMLPPAQPWVRHDLCAALRDEPAAVRENLRLTALRWSWMRRLPSKRARWGRDLVGLQALAQVLTEISGPEGGFQTWPDLASGRHN